MKYKLKKFITASITGILLGILISATSPFTVAAAPATYTPDQITFTVKTNASIYRVVFADAWVNITANVSSSPALKAGDAIIAYGGYQPIRGFYLQNVGAGCTGSCSYESQSPRVDAIPADIVLPVQHAFFPQLQPSQQNASRQILIYPLIYLLSGPAVYDIAFFSNSAPITIEAYADQTALVNAAKASCQADPNQVGCNPDGSVQNPNIGGKSTTATVTQKTWDPAQLSFKISTDGSIYRVVQGQSVSVAVTSANSQGIAVGDTLKSTTGNYNIQGFYTASVEPVPGLNICTLAVCTFTFESTHQPSPNFTAPLGIDSSKILSSHTAGPNGTADKHTLSVFPVIDLSGSVAFPLTNNAAQITLEVYSDQTALNQAAVAYCKANPGVPGCDANGGVTNSAVSGAPVSSTATGSRNTGVVGGVFDTLGGFLIAVVNIVLGVILAILRWLISILATYIFIPLLVNTFSMTAGDFASGPILVGWTLVRDIVNMFFILGLIVIGFGTILKIESYNYKKLLVNLIIMAILVNFSLLIGRIIIGILDTVQFTFLPVAQGSTAINDLYAKLYASDNFGLQATVNAAASVNSQLMATMTLLFQFVLELGVVITFGALAIFMLIRTVALWILLMLSPVAYALFILPATASTAKKWWSSFIKYALFAPLMAFFLRLSFVMYEQGLLFNKLTTGVSSNGTNTTGGMSALLQGVLTNGASFQQFLELLLVYMMILAFLWGAMIVTQQMGIFGASAIVGLAERGMKAPFGAAGWAGKRGLGLAGRKWNEFTTKHIRGEGQKVGWGRSLAFALANPVATVRGWNKRAEDLNKSARDKATAAGLEAVEQRLTGGRKVIPRQQAVERAEEDEFVKEYNGLTREQQIAMADHLAGGKSQEARRQQRGLVKVALSNGFIDDITTDTSDEFRKAAGYTEEDYAHELDENGNEIMDQQHRLKAEDGRDAVKENSISTQRKMLGYLMGDDQSALRMMAEDGVRYGKETGHWEYLAHSWFNPKEGEYQWRPDAGEGNGSDYAANELAKMDSRTQARAAYHSFMESLRSGKIDKAVFRTWATAVTENPTFTQERNPGAMLTGKRSMSEEDRQYLKETGVLKIDVASLRRIHEMMQISPEAVSAVYQRLTKQGVRPEDIAGRVKSGFQVEYETVENGQRVTKREKIIDKARAAQLSSPAVAVAQKALEEKTVEGPQREAIESQLKSKEQGAQMPDLDGLIAAIESVVNNRTKAIQISNNFLDKLADKKSSLIDYGSEMNRYVPQGVTAKMSGQEMAQLGNVLQKAVKEALVRGATIPSSQPQFRRAEIAGTVKKQLEEFGKSINIPDLHNQFNSTLFAQGVSAKMIT